MYNISRPTEAYVPSPEQLVLIERNSLKGVKFTADGKMVIDPRNEQNPSTNNSKVPLLSE
jgi:hypothetical protein